MIVQSIFQHLIRASYKSSIRVEEFSQFLDSILYFIILFSPKNFFWKFDILSVLSFGIIVLFQHFSDFHESKKYKK